MGQKLYRKLNYRNIRLDSNTVGETVFDTDRLLLIGLVEFDALKNRRP